MKKIFAYLGLAFVACLSCFSLTAVAAEHGRTYVVSTMHSVADDGSYGSAMTRLELTLAQWRADVSNVGLIARSDMRAASNGFVFESLSESRTLESAVTV